MKNTILLFIVVILIPFAVVSFDKKETNFFNEQNNSSPNLEATPQVLESSPIQVKINFQNQELTLDLEDYLIGVVAAEMPASFNSEALKAQAVAARTYAYYKILQNKTLATTTADQAYIDESAMHTKWGTDFSFYYAKIKEAVTATNSEIMTYDNHPIIAYYFAMSNGYTESSSTVFKESLPYLQSVKSDWEKNNRSYEVSYSYTDQELCLMLNLSCTKITFSNPVYSNTNHLSSIEVNGQTFTGIELRQKLNLRSTAITIDQNHHITTTGYGHGVGMSQYGANGLANKGATYQEILKYYYQDIEIQKI